MADSVKLFLAGDVMTGRGVDQVLPKPSAPSLYESYVRDARRYVELAEQVNGPIRRPVDYAYVWGDALALLDRAAPDVRIVNLETSVTRSDAFWVGKRIHYRMHPANVACLTAAGLDCCVLANNHVIDWGFAGLEDTLSTLQAAGIRTCGAGSTAAEARAPAIIELAEGSRVLVFAFGFESSGIPERWAASGDSPGVSMVSGQESAAQAVIAGAIDEFREPGDIIIVSLHWGDNWGYAVPPGERELAHALIEHAGVDIIHGHSSHHAKAVDIHRGRPILYGCGDFINDYEGISGYEEFRSDLRLAYLVEIEPESTRPARVSVVPFKAQRLRLGVASDADVDWVRAMLERECAPFVIRIERARHDTLILSLGDD